MDFDVSVTLNLSDVTKILTLFMHFSDSEQIVLVYIFVIRSAHHVTRQVTQNNWWTTTTINKSCADFITKIFLLLINVQKPAVYAEAWNKFYFCTSFTFFCNHWLFFYKTKQILYQTTIYSTKFKRPRQKYQTGEIAQCFPIAIIWNFWRWKCSMPTF